MNIAKLAEALGLNESAYLELIDLLVETSKADMAQIESALRSADSDAAGRAFHSIKGAAANLGLTKISELAKQGEHTAQNKALDQLPPVFQQLKTELDVLSKYLSTRTA
jgi:HPt (histidine-containing phosphotransfer) domain-containing protein